MATSKLGKILDKVVPIDSNHYREQKKLLWTNASPDSSFPYQNIGNIATGYDELECVWGFGYNRLRKTSRFSAVNGTVVFVNFTNNSTSDTNVCGFRTIAITSNGVVVENGFFRNADANNIIVPLKIYGIKNQ